MWNNLGLTLNNLYLLGKIHFGLPLRKVFNKSKCADLTLRVRTSFIFKGSVSLPFLANEIYPEKIAYNNKYQDKIFLKFLMTIYSVKEKRKAGWNAMQ